VFIAAASTAYSFQNADAATIFGLELDTQLGLGRLSPALELFSVQANYSWIDSDVTVRGGSTGGGGISATGDVFLNGATVTGNSGGGIDVGDGAHLTMTDSEVSDNVTDFRGAGITIFRGALTMTSSTVSGNRVIPTASADLPVLPAGGGVYVHVLQPNQYFSKRRFSEAERALALRDDHPYRPGVEAGYPALVGRFADLRDAGVGFYSGLELLDHEPGLVYSDDCCHYNARGNDMLVDFIAAAILERLGGEAGAP